MTVPEVAGRRRTSSDDPETMTGRWSSDCLGGFELSDDGRRRAGKPASKRRGKFDCYRTVLRARLGSEPSDLLARIIAESVGPNGPPVLVAV